MGVEHFLRPGLHHKQPARVLTVDPTNRRFELAFRDGGKVYATLPSVPAALRMPKTGEVWYVRQDNGTWVMETRVILTTDIDEEKTPEQMDEGELRLDAEVITDANGRELVHKDYLDTVVEALQDQIDALQAQIDLLTP